MDGYHVDETRDGTKPNKMKQDGTKQAQRIDNRETTIEMQMQMQMKVQMRCHSNPVTATATGTAIRIIIIIKNHKRNRKPNATPLHSRNNHIRIRKNINQSTMTTCLLPSGMGCGVCDSTL
jgi:hypothetical protein